MKVITLIALLVLIIGVTVIFLPEIIRITQPTHSLSSGLNKIGDLFVSADLPDIADKVYDTSLRVEPGNFESFVDKGDLFRSLGKNSDALTFYSRSLMLNPESISVLKKKSDLLQTLGRTDEAHLILENIARLQPGNPSDQLTVIHSLMSSGNYKEATNKIDDLLKTQPDNADFWEIRGDALFALATTDTTLTDQLGSLQQKNGKTPDVVLKSTLTRNQAFSDGIESYRKVLLLDPLRSPEIGEKLANTAQGFGIIMKSDELLNTAKQS